DNEEGRLDAFSLQRTQHRLGRSGPRPVVEGQDHFAAGKRQPAAELDPADGRGLGGIDVQRSRDAEGVRIDAAGGQTWWECGAGRQRFSGKNNPSDREDGSTHEETHPDDIPDDSKAPLSNEDSVNHGGKLWSDRRALRMPAEAVAAVASRGRATAALAGDP